MPFLRLQQEIQLIDLFFKLTVLPPGILFKFDLFVENCFFMTEIAHTINESFQNGLKLSNCMLVFFIEVINDPGSILIINLLLQ